MNSNVRRGRAALLVALTGVLTAVLAGCSSSVSASDLGAEINTQLKGQGVAVDNDAVTCPQDLPAEVGQSVTCEFATGGTPSVAVTTVTAVEGDDVKFGIEYRPK